MKEDKKRREKEKGLGGRGRVSECGRGKQGRRRGVDRERGTAKRWGEGRGREMGRRNERDWKGGRRDRKLK